MIYGGLHNVLRLLVKDADEHGRAKCSDVTFNHFKKAIPEQYAMFFEEDGKKYGRITHDGLVVKAAIESQIVTDNWDRYWRSLGKQKSETDG